ncbi:diacylglycerol kinase family protein [Salinisphaera sp.]|uniref:diacylglycerol kinase family protein n=1 Tax=Salinisphaera sp. TaxID=1914330 RepID=UPI002D7775AE|nr:diacylglycerol kinase family protein [Salinisphaera sp.]HET7313151.1 diacylglycerol kinase family protein [Salinisphaera sp.]
MAEPERSSASPAPRRLGIIYNSQSGRHRRRWGRHPVPTDVPAIEANRPDEIGAAVAELAAHGVNALAVAGGDGTVQCVLSHVLLADHFDTPPVLALVPTGSTNMTARDVGFVDVRRHGWQPLLDWAAGGTSARATTRATIADRAVLRIQASDGQAPICGMFFGAGAIHHAVQYTQNRLHSVGLRGEVGPSLAFLRFLKSVALRDRRYFAPTRVRLTDDAGRALDDPTLLFVASTLGRLVLGFRPFWGAESAPIAWTAVSQNASRFLLRLPFVARGWSPGLGGGAKDAGYVSHNSRELRLEFDDGFIVDGEFHHSRPGDGPVRLSVAGRLPFLSL